MVGWTTRYQPPTGVMAQATTPTPILESVQRNKNLKLCNFRTFFQSFFPTTFATIPQIYSFLLLFIHKEVNISHTWTPWPPTEDKCLPLYELLVTLILCCLCLASQCDSFISFLPCFSGNQFSPLLSLPRAVAKIKFLFFQKKTCYLQRS